MRFAHFGNLAHTQSSMWFTHHGFPKKHDTPFRDDVSHSVSQGTICGIPRPLGPSWALLFLGNGVIFFARQTLSTLSNLARVLPRLCATFAAGEFDNWEIIRIWRAVFNRTFYLFMTFVYSIHHIMSACVLNWFLYNVTWLDIRHLEANTKWK